MTNDGPSDQIDLFATLERESEITFCEEGEVLFKQGESPRALYMVQAGEASLFLYSPDGSTIATFHADRGSLLGMPAALTKKPYSLTARAHKGLVVGVIPLEKFDRLLEQKPTLYPAVLTILASQVQAARSVLTDPSFDALPWPNLFKDSGK